jgi:hypothetical protein
VNPPARDPTKSLIRSLTDRMLDAYVEWRETEAVVQDRFTSWSHSSRSDRSIRYASYLAALDGEERVAENYARQIRELANALAVMPTLDQSRTGAPRHPDTPRVGALSPRRSRSRKLWRQ